MASCSTSIFSMQTTRCCLHQPRASLGDFALHTAPTKPRPTIESTVICAARTRCGQPRRSCHVSIEGEEIEVSWTWPYEWPPHTKIPTRHSTNRRDIHMPPGDLTEWEL